MIRINLLPRDPKKIQKARKLTTVQTDEKSWNPWSEQAISVPYLRDDNYGIGPGEKRIVAEPSAPCFGGQIQGASTHYDVVKDGRKWEVKGLGEGYAAINIGAASNQYVTDFVVNMGSALKQVEQLDAFLSGVGPKTAQDMIRAGFSICGFREFLREIVPKLKVGTEIARGTIQRTYHQFDSIAGLIQKFSSVSAETGEVVVDWKGKLIHAKEIPLDLLIDVLERAGEPVESVPELKLAHTLRKIDHPWLTSSGSLANSWQNMAKASDVLAEATDGIFIVHSQFGWFLLHPDELDDYLSFERITRRSLSFSLKKVPKRPEQGSFDFQGGQHGVVESGVGEGEGVYPLEPDQHDRTLQQDRDPERELADEQDGRA